MRTSFERADIMSGKVTENLFPNITNLIDDRGGGDGNFIVQSALQFRCIEKFLIYCRKHFISNFAH